jgi:hypothetical protein
MDSHGAHELGTSAIQIAPMSKPHMNPPVETAGSAQESACPNLQNSPRQNFPQVPKESPSLLNTLMIFSASCSGPSSAISNQNGLSSKLYSMTSVKNETESDPQVSQGPFSTALQNKAHLDPQLYQRSFSPTILQSMNQSETENHLKGLYAETTQANLLSQESTIYGAEPSKSENAFLIKPESKPFGEAADVGQHDDSGQENAKSSSHSHVTSFFPLNLLLQPITVDRILAAQGAERVVGKGKNIQFNRRSWREVVGIDQTVPIGDTYDTEATRTHITPLKEMPLPTENSPCTDITLLPPPGTLEIAVAVRGKTPGMRSSLERKAFSEPSHTPFQEEHPRVGHGKQTQPTDQSFKNPQAEAPTRGMRGLTQQGGIDNQSA